MPTSSLAQPFLPVQTAATIRIAALSLDLSFPAPWRVSFPGYDAADEPRNNGLEVLPSLHTTIHNEVKLLLPSLLHTTLIRYFPPRPAGDVHLASFNMALSNVGSLVLNLLIFITTLVNFSYALTSLEPLLLLGLYAISKIFVTAPEAGIFAKCQLGHLYQDG